MNRETFLDYFIALGFISWAVLGVFLLWFNLTTTNFQEWFYIETGVRLWEIM